MVWSLKLSIREGCAVEVITFHTELERHVIALVWNVGIACRMLLGMEVVESAGHNFDNEPWTEYMLQHIAT